MLGPVKFNSSYIKSEEEIYFGLIFSKKNC